MDYLVRVNKRYYFRVRIPKDLSHSFKKREIKRSLKTRELQYAKSLVKVLSSKMEQVFMLARCGLITDEQIQKLIEEHIQVTLNTLEKERAEGKRIPKLSELEGDDIDENDYGAYHGCCQEGIERCNRALMTNDLTFIEDTADEFLEEKSLAVAKDSVDYKKLCREMLKAWVFIYKIESERIEGNYDNDFDRFTRKALQREMIAVGQAAQGGEGRLLSSVMESYIQDKTPNWGHKTELENRHIFKLALSIIGDRDVQSLTRSDFLRYRDILVQLTPNFEKKKEYQGKSPEEIIKITKDKGLKSLSTKTINKNVLGMSTLMSWCVRQDLVDKNYASELGIKDKTKPSERRKPFDDEDLQKLFASPVYTSSIPANAPEKFFVPLVALFSGARLNEICSLYVKDIRTVDGVPCIDINDDTDDKQVKTDSSPRLVPIHPKLIEVGFMDYVESLRQREEARLWPNLNYTKGNGYGGAFGKWFGRYCKEHVTQDTKKVFHSFRHTVANCLKQTGVDYKRIEAILGHKDESMSTGYYAEAYETKVLLEALKHLDFQNVLVNVKFRVDR
jgi:integrase